MKQLSDEEKKENSIKDYMDKQKAALQASLMVQNSNIYESVDQQNDQQHNFNDFLRPSTHEAGINGNVQYDGDDETYDPDSPNHFV